MTVDFPVNRRVIVQAREEVGQFPQMVFTGQSLRELGIKATDQRK